MIARSAQLFMSQQHRRTSRADGQRGKRGLDRLARQSFIAPSGSSTLSFWYLMSCPDTVRYDWVTATLRDLTAGRTTTIVPKKICTRSKI